MKIYSKEAFAIGPGAQVGTTDIDSFITVPGTFQNMPDKYANDPTFKLAVRAGKITVIESRQQQVKIENEPPKDELNHKAGMSEIEAFYAELKTMSQDETLVLGEKYGLSMGKNEKLGQFKKRVMEAYKLSVEEATEEE